MRITADKETLKEKWFLTSMSGLYLSSKMAIAASDPEPMVTKLGHFFSQRI